MIAFAVCFSLCLLLLSRFSQLYILDSPNERSLHDTPVPRTGGVATLLTIVVGGIMLAQFQVCPTSMDCIDSNDGCDCFFMDDLWKGSLLYRIAVYVLAAAFLIEKIPLGWMFMGGVGSAPAGVLVAGLGFWCVWEGLFDWRFLALVFVPFIIDATITLLRRMLHNERIWEAYRSHYYQHLLQIGWGYKKRVLFGWSFVYIGIVFFIQRSESVGEV